MTAAAPELKVGPDWFLADFGGLRLFGPASNASQLRKEGWAVVEFACCYELKCMVGQDGKGNTVAGASLTPFALLGLACPVRVQWQAIACWEDMAPQDREFLRGLVEAAEKTKTTLRASRAKLVLA